MSNTPTPWWVQNIFGRLGLFKSGVGIAAQPNLNFEGAGVTVTPDPANRANKVTIPGIGGIFGPSADPVVSFAADVATSDATPTAFATGDLPYILPDKTLVDVVVTVVGKKVASTESFVQDYRARYVRNGGGAMLIGSVIDGANPIGTGALAGAAATILLSGNTIAPQVTGIAATNISWKATMQVTPIVTET